MGRITLTKNCSSSLLGLILRQKLITNEVGSKFANNEMMTAILWLTQVSRNLVKWTGGKETGGGGFFFSSFLECSLENTHRFRTWFVDTWNSTWVLELRALLKERPELQAQGDPVVFVVRSWPWRDDIAGENGTELVHVKEKSV